MATKQYKSMIVTERWTTSRARDTYGYNICSLWADGVKMASCNGGGYDMQGTVFGELLVNLFPARLSKIASGAHSKYRVTVSKGMIPIPPTDGALYGLYAYYQRGKPVRVSVDGACGMGSVERIAGAIGVSITKLSGNNRGDNRVWSVSWWE